jgi:hypothetical protein
MPYTQNVFIERLKHINFVVNTMTVAFQDLPLKILLVYFNNFIQIVYFKERRWTENSRRSNSCYCRKQLIINKYNFILIN